MVLSRFFAASFAALVMSVLPATAHALPSVTLTGPASVTAGASFTVDVHAANIADLYAYQFDVGFDSALIRLDGVHEGGFLESAGPTLFDPGSMDNSNGTVSFIFATLLGPMGGVDDDGVLATLSFTSLAAGTSLFELGNLILVDSALNVIPADIGQLAVTAVPEPASWGLMLAGGALLVLRHRRYLRGRRQHRGAWKGVPATGVVVHTMAFARAASSVRSQP